MATSLRIMGRPPPGSDRSRGCRRSRGTAPSRPPAGWLAAPGQRRSMPVCRPARRWATGSGTSCGGPAGRSCELEGVEDRLDARVVAVGVVVGGADAEVAEPADELRDVRADELEHRLALLQRAGAVLERRAGDLLEAGQLARGLDEVVVGAGPAHERARGRRSSAWRRARAGAARAGTAPGPSSRAWSRRPAGRGRRASRAGSRTSSCRAAASSAAAPAPRESARFSAAIAPVVAFALPTSVGEVVAALGDRRHRARGARR